MGAPDWRIGEARAALAPDGVTELAGPNWRGCFERLSFGSGFHMHLGRIESEGDAELLVTGGGAEPRSISAFTLISGRQTLRMEGWPEVALEPGRAHLFIAKDGRGLFRMTGRQVVRFFSVAVAPSLLVDLLDRRIPEALAGLIESGGRETIVKERVVSATTRALIQDLGQPGEAGALQRLHREAVAIRLLTEMVEAELAEAHETPILSSREEAGVRAARAQLTADLRAPPSAVMLAEAAGLPLRRFLRAFEAIHGLSPAQLLRQTRLGEGRRLIETGDLPLKAIAWQVGYGHVSNFTAAFAEQYGAPPRRFTRQRLVAE